MADINLGVGGANSAVAGGYDIANSYKNENDNVEKMTHTYDSAPTSQQKGTISIWYKRTEINTNIGIFQFGDDASGDYLAVRWATEANGSIETYRSKINGTSVNIGDANGAVRDTSAWYHMVIAIDTTQATATNRFRVYRNGEELSFSTDNRSSITQNANMAIGENGKDILIGEGVYRFNGYIAEVNYIDGQQLSSTDFGKYDADSGIWIPKQYTGTYGNNGFYLDFKNASNLGEDQSGNNHDFTLNNITSANQATDTPTNNFCTLNPLSAGGNLGNVITEGATKVVIENNGQQVAVGTIAVSTGKWYWEAKHTSGTYQFAGIISADSRVSGNGGVADSSVAGSDAIALYRPTGQLYYNGTGTTFDTNSYTNGDIIGVALDMDNGTCALYKNGSIMGNTGSNDIVAKSGHASLTGAWTAMYSDGTNGTFNITYEVNFGGYHNYTISSGNTDENGYGNFEYTPPSGYYALCSKNLAEYG